VLCPAHLVSSFQIGFKISRNGRYLNQSKYLIVSNYHHLNICVQT
jgi:hypothetical protein